MDIILSPVVQDDQLDLLSVVISEYLQKRIVLSADKSIKPPSQIPHPVR